MTEENKNHEQQSDSFDELDIADFFEEEEPIETGKRRRFIVKMIAILISLVMVIQVLNIWFNLFSVDSLNLLRSSKQLSEDEMIQELKESVVTIQTGGSKGTGFTISADGYILTNHHVIDSSEPLLVAFPSGKRFVAELIESNERFDLALLKVDAENLDFLSLSKQAGSVGERVYVIGNPLLHTQIVNEGELIEHEALYDRIKISAPIFRGHSGSPVLSERGEVVGVVYAKTIPSPFRDEESVGLAVPIDTVINQLKNLPN